MFKKMVQRLVCSLYQRLSKLFLWYVGIMECTIFFIDRSRVRCIRLLANSIPLDEPIMKVRGYGMIAYFMKIPNLKYWFFTSITKFQKCMFKRIHWILTSPNSTTSALHNRSLHIGIHYTLIEYENEKVNQPIILFN